jgi:uncharacterized protein involved in exopolysaccharide biosynthesis/Mrp family chromosome partitioning ATPase
VDNLTAAKMASLLKRKFKIIMTFALIGFLTGILYSLLIFKPNYQSTAKLLIKDNDPTAFVTEFGNPSKITPLGTSTNPLLTQMEVLKSDEYARKVWEQINEKYDISADEAQGAKMLRNAIEVKNPVGTDVLTITANWNDSQIAKDIAQAFASVYINSNKDIAKQGIFESKQALDKQLVEAEYKLQQIRNSIKDFKENNATVDIKVESENIVNQIANLESKYDDVRSMASAEANKVSSLGKNLGIDWRKAITSVALGSNPNITELQNKLADKQQEQASLATKYTVSHPAKVAVDAEVHNLKEQLVSQIKTTIGSSAESNNIMINDPVRTGMMESLIASEAAYRGYQAQAGALKRAISSLKGKKARMPQKQLSMDNALQQEASLAAIVDALKTKQAEADIREAQVISNITLVDSPIIPMFASFPNRVHVIILFALFGSLLGTASILISEAFKNTYDEAEELEKDLNTSVLGVIPWLEQDVYEEPGMRFAIDETASYYSLAYQKIVSGLRIKGYNSNHSVLAFTSSEFSKFRSSIILNTAYGLSKTGQSVVVVDADFRTPSVSQEFGLKASEKFNLGELIMEISREKRSTGNFNWEKINYFIQVAPQTNKLHIIPNVGNTSDPCEFLHSVAFSELIQELKKMFDWVLIDVPPVLAVPDALSIGNIIDSVVLITGLDADKTVIKKISKQFKNYNVPILGVITRAHQTKEAASSNEYIKQIISRMMPTNEPVLAE